MVRLFGREDRRRHKLLSAYVDGEVTAEEAREVEDLLETSENARRELAELQAMVELVRGLPELEPPRSFALDAAPKKRWTLWWPSVRTTGLATSVAAMLLVALVAGDMLNVLEQARFGADESGYASDDSAFAAAAPAQEAMAGAAMDTSASPEPEAALMKSAAVQEESPQVPAAPAAAAARAAKVESSEEPVAAMQMAATDEAPQADQAGPDEEPQVAMQSVMAADEPQADEAESSEEPVAVMQQAAMDDGEIIEGDAVVDYYEIDDHDPEGIILPLVELQVVVGIVVVALVGATLVAVLRRRRSFLQREE
ncbi:MAG: hypothetical protein F4W93_01620 [Dehalococcoidia bacterium]|nr:hypothetical protein [Dehalococcoidia bacterium]